MAKRRCKHPDFEGYRRFTGNPKYTGIFVFQRAHWKEPTPEQLADYRHRRKIVEDNGGSMRRMEWMCAGQNPRFTEADCRAMKQAVRKSNPDLKIVDDWNGVGVYGYSVAVAKR